MTDLDQLLKNKAEAKLEKEISDFILGIRKHKFFQAIEQSKVSTGEDKTETMRYFFWGNKDYPAAKLIKEKFIEEYVFNESKQFMDDVQEFKRKLNDLTTQQDY